MISLKNIVKFLVSIFIPLGVGFLSGYITKDSMNIYQNLIRPSFAPPGYIFSIVWTILYILMGIASYRVYVSEKSKYEVKDALTFYFIQLALNFLWPIVYFNLGFRFLALILIIILWILILVTTIKFFQIDKIAGYLMVPYLLWVSFAAILNYSTWKLNR
ncbi:TspO/MBR family protein [Alkalithermobacter thermoalcaliphilus]|uniref:TspO/MBR family protein n=1 Tax=Clostridium paradoxum TaxID=29346 RepID=UPI002F90B418